MCKYSNIGNIVEMLTGGVVKKYVHKYNIVEMRYDYGCGITRKKYYYPGKNKCCSNIW